MPNFIKIGHPVDTWQRLKEIGFDKYSFFDHCTTFTSKPIFMRHKYYNFYQHIIMLVFTLNPNSDSNPRQRSLNPVFNKLTLKILQKRKFFNKVPLRGNTFIQNFGVQNITPTCTQSSNFDYNAQSFRLDNVRNMCVC